MRVVFIFYVNVSTHQTKDDKLELAHVNFTATVIGKQIIKLLVATCLYSHQFLCWQMHIWHMNHDCQRQVDKLWLLSHVKPSQTHGPCDHHVTDSDSEQLVFDSHSHIKYAFANREKPFCHQQFDNLVVNNFCLQCEDALRKTCPHTEICAMWLTPRKRL